MSAISEHSSAYEVSALALDFIDLEYWGTSELTWLNAHPPSPCYAKAWTHWKAAAGYAEDAGVVGFEGAVNVDPELLAEATALMERLDDSVTATFDEVTVATGKCP
ncbi:MAG: hypothetical protein AABZ33_14555 [Chloroflexota bacterium]